MKKILKEAIIAENSFCYNVNTWQEKLNLASSLISVQCLQHFDFFLFVAVQRPFFHQWQKLWDIVTDILAGTYKLMSVRHLDSIQYYHFYEIFLFLCTWHMEIAWCNTIHSSLASFIFKSWQKTWSPIAARNRKLLYSTPFQTLLVITS